MRNFSDELQVYFKKGDVRTYKKRQSIQADSYGITQIYYIDSGYIRIFGCNNRNEEYTHTIYGPGDVYPIAWAFNTPLSNITAEGLTTVKLYAISAVKLNEDLPKHVGLACGLLQRSVAQYRNYAVRVVNLEYKYASERLGGHLLALAGSFGKPHDNGIVIIPPFTQRLLATSINLSRESISREMEKLIRRHLIAYTGERQIFIPSVQALAAHLQLPLPTAL